MQENTKRNMSYAFGSAEITYGIYLLFGDNTLAGILLLVMGVGCFLSVWLPPVVEKLEKMIEESKNDQD